jgi:hypothetical protein
MRLALTIALAGLAVVSGLALAPATATVTAGAATSTDGPAADDACAELAENPPANPETDQLGWENGCWADEALSITREDGLNETELDAVVARSMARVEAVRELEFE